MYELYYNKNTYEIKVKFLSSGLKNQSSRLDETPLKYNSYYWLCSKKKPLLEIANEMKSEWLIELESDIEKVKNIEIK